jgi:hypothetical protein
MKKREKQSGGQSLQRHIAVCSNHVHMVAEPCHESIEEIVSRYKNIGMFALRRCGRAGRIRTRGFDKRFCFSEDELSRRTEYVQQHDDSPPGLPWGEKCSDTRKLNGPGPCSIGQGVQLAPDVLVCSRGVIQ